MANKTTMHYRVVSARNPKTGGTLLRPVVTNRATLSMSQLVAYAKTAGYVRGQQKDLEGLLGGFIEAMKDRSLAGYAINVNNWYIISGRLKGTVDETRTLTDLNDYHVTITATADLKAAMSDFNWQRVDDGSVVVKIETIMSPGGKNGEIIKTKTWSCYGKNLQFNAALGDSVTASWLDATSGEKQSKSLTPTESDYGHMTFAADETISALPDNTEIVLSFRTRGGVEGGAEFPVTKVVTLVAAT